MPQPHTDPCLDFLNAFLVAGFEAVIHSELPTQSHHWSI